MRISFTVLVATCGSLLAADHLNLEEGLPTQLEDAYPIAYRGREIQTHISYEHQDDGKDRLTLQPQVEFGFAPNAQGKITVPFYLGDADKKEAGTSAWRRFTISTRKAFTCLLLPSLHAPICQPVAKPRGSTRRSKPLQRKVSPALAWTACI